MRRTEHAPVVWITGLSGTGKTTAANALARQLRAEGRAPLVLDGDEFRAAVGDELGHSYDERLLSARRLIRFAALASSQGIPVIVATMSLIPEVHPLVRRSLPNVRVVYLHAPIPFLAARDSKGLYAAALAGKRQHVVGVDLPASPPPEPDLSIDVSRNSDLEDLVHQIRCGLGGGTPIITA